ncbi:MAG TPA: hypothetical protein VK272_03255 [Solirubrobacteraceae bacterium]|nr:hypothetical protein [Solirubrobacteraceae bacterium]
MLLAAGGVGRGGAVALAGVVVIGVSVLPWPWGTERYRRVCARMLAKAARDIEVAHGQARVAESARVCDLRGIAAPDGLLSEHNELLRRCSADEALQQDRTGPLQARALRHMEVRDRIRELRQRVSELVTTSDEKQYRVKLEAMMIAREEAVEARAEESGRILSRLVADQVALKPPESLRDAHDVMCRAFREEIAAMWEYHLALHDGDADAIRAASMRLEDALDVCATRVEALGIRTVYARAQARRRG